MEKCNQYSHINKMILKKGKEKLFEGMKVKFYFLFNSNDSEETAKIIFLNNQLIFIQFHSFHLILHTKKFHYLLN